MNPQLENLQQAADGLLFMSESDHPFKVIQLSPGNNTSIEQQIQVVAKTEGPIEQQTVDYFFRNAVKVYPDGSELQKQTALKFQTLLELVKTELEDVQVYRTGNVEVDAFIIGRLKDGTYGGLRTKLIET